MDIQENAPVGRKTTMRIGGSARYFAQAKTQADIEEATQFAEQKKLPLFVLGSGSNTIFADGTIEAVVIQIIAEAMTFDGATVTVEAGKNLANLINAAAEHDLDLSALTGIPGTVGGAIFGNAGQGPIGIWIDSFIESITAFVDGRWKTFSKEECRFRYRESAFKDMTGPIIIWQATLNLPAGRKNDIKANVEALLKKRIETQPHLKTAGSCFKAVGDKPAWQLIDAVGLRGYKVGDVQIAEKHANFLLNTGKATFADALSLIRTVKEKIPENLEVEMRFVKEDGSLATQTLT